MPDGVAASRRLVFRLRILMFTLSGRRSGGAMAQDRPNAGGCFPRA